MGLGRGYELATDAQFKELSNFITPPRAGKVTVLESNGQVRVDTDDPDGGDVLAWPLNGFTYSVDDVVYVSFGVNSPDSAIVLGSKGAATPTLSAYIRRSGVDILTGDWDIGEDRRILAEALRARDSEGLKLEDDAGNVGVFVQDGGHVILGGSSHLASIDSIVELIGDFGTNSPMMVFDTRSAIVGSGGNYAGGGYTTGTTVPARFGLFGLLKENATAGNFIGQLQVYLNSGGSANAIALALTILGSNGNIGNMATPLGQLHFHDGTSGIIFESKTAINVTPQTIIPNGTGDVTGAMICYTIVDVAGTVATNTFSLTPGNNQDLVVGTLTLRLALNANGALTCLRQAGTGTAELTLFAIWQ